MFITDRSMKTFWLGSLAILTGIFLCPVAMTLDGSNAHTNLALYAVTYVVGVMSTFVFTILTAFNLIYKARQANVSVYIAILVIPASVPIVAVAWALPLYMQLYL